MASAAPAFTQKDLRKPDQVIEFLEEAGLRRAQTKYPRLYRKLTPATKFREVLDDRVRACVKAAASGILMKRTVQAWNRYAVLNRVRCPAVQLEPTRAPMDAIDQ